MARGGDAARARRRHRGALRRPRPGQARGRAGRRRHAAAPRRARPRGGDRRLRRDGRRRPLGRRAQRRALRPDERGGARAGTRRPASRSTRPGATTWTARAPSSSRRSRGRPRTWPACRCACCCGSCARRASTWGCPGMSALARPGVLAAVLAAAALALHPALGAARLAARARPPSCAALLLLAVARRSPRARPRRPRAAPGRGARPRPGRLVLVGALGVDGAARAPRHARPSPPGQSRGNFDEAGPGRPLARPAAARLRGRRRARVRGGRRSRSPSRAGGAPVELTPRARRRLRRLPLRAARAPRPTGGAARLRVAASDGARTLVADVAPGAPGRAGDLTIALEQYFPDFALDEQQQPFSRSAEPRNPAALLTVEKGGRRTAPSSCSRCRASTASRGSASPSRCSRSSRSGRSRSRCTASRPRSPRSSARSSWPRASPCPSARARARRTSPIADGPVARGRRGPPRRSCSWSDRGAVLGWSFGVAAAAGRVPLAGVGRPPRRRPGRGPRRVPAAGGADGWRAGRGRRGRRGRAALGLAVAAGGEPASLLAVVRGGVLPADGATAPLAWRWPASRAPWPFSRGSLLATRPGAPPLVSRARRPLALPLAARRWRSALAIALRRLRRARATAPTRRRAAAAAAATALLGLAALETTRRRRPAPPRVPPVAPRPRGRCSPAGARRLTARVLSSRRRARGATGGPDVRRDSRVPALNVHGGAIDGYEMKLSPGMTVIIGSGRLAHMRLDHPEIELAHVKVAWDDHGISMIDNGSRKGTWVNGEPVETVSLLDGDVIEFVAPGSKSTPPKVKVRIPKGSVPEPPPPPPPTPEELAARPAPAAARGPPAAQGRGPARRRGEGPRLPDLRLVGLAGGGARAPRRRRRGSRSGSSSPRPRSTRSQPAAGGARADGHRDRASASTATPRTTSCGSATARWPRPRSSGGTLQVKVPGRAARGAGPPRRSRPARGRSTRRPFVVRLPLQAASLDPAGALPGDEVVLHGSGFAEGVVGHAWAAPRRAWCRPRRAPCASRCRRSRARRAAATRSWRRWARAARGRFPSTSAACRSSCRSSPRAGVAGDLVRIRGAGFAAERRRQRRDLRRRAGPGRRRERHGAGGGRAAVRCGRSRRRSPRWSCRPGARPRRTAPSSRCSGSSRAPGCRASSRAPWAREGRRARPRWAPRSRPCCCCRGRTSRARWGSARCSVASALNAAVDRARVGQAAAFEAREQPAIGVALVGAPDLLVRVTPQDAAAYETPPGLPVRGAPPTPIALARHWAALLNDTVVVGTSGGKPAAAARHHPGGRRRVRAAARGPAVAVRQRRLERAGRGPAGRAEAAAARGGAPGALRAASARGRGGRRAAGAGRPRGSSAAPARCL